MQWRGQCPSCGGWNTMQARESRPAGRKAPTAAAATGEPARLSEAALADFDSILGLPDAPEQLVSRTRQLIVAAGGALPGAISAPASEPGATSVSGG